MISRLPEVKVMICVLVVTASSACQWQKDAPDLSQISSVQIDRSGSEKPESFCQDFSLSEEAAVEFMQKSRIVDARELHDNYEHLPCYVKGTLDVENSRCRWEIRAGGTGALECDDKDALLLVCDDCDDLFGGGTGN